MKKFFSCDEANLPLCKASQRSAHEQTNARGESRAKIEYEISRISEIPQNFEGISGFLVGFPWICGNSINLILKDMCRN